jgi:serine/threonine protein kinase
VIAIHDVELSSPDLPFLVTDFVEGTSLASRPRCLEVTPTLAILQQVARGLSAIHGRGFVHRDLKPGNILIEERAQGPLVTITDFGISTLVRPFALQTSPVRTASLTESGKLLGTPAYLAPELTQGMKAATTGADVFAMGVIAFELLTGQSPFVEAPVLAELRGVYRPPPSLAGAAQGLDPALARLFDRCFLADPSARPEARDLADALDSLPR